jgi:hypothetical protein
MNKEELTEINRAIHKYYTLKMKYESKINAFKNKINDAYKSSREKRDAFLKQKITCVNCNRPVKTIFKTTYNDNTNSRMLIAKCGDVLNPCGLNIKIDVGYSEMLPDLIQQQEDNLSKLKNDIINAKNNALFGYITNEEAIANFKNMKDDVSQFTEMLELYYYSYLHTKPNKDAMNSLQYNIYELINNIKTEVKADNPENAVGIYLSDLKPELDKLMKLKYHMNLVEYDPKSEIYTLIQRPNAPHDFEHVNGNPKIISYVTDLPDEDDDDDGDNDEGQDEDDNGDDDQDEGNNRRGKKTKKKGENAKKKEKAPKKEKVLTEKQRIKLRVKNNEPIDWGDSDDEDEADNEQLEQAQQEREIEQEY